MTAHYELRVQYHDTSSKYIYIYQHNYTDPSYILQWDLRFALPLCYKLFFQQLIIPSRMDCHLGWLGLQQLSVEILLQNDPPPLYPNQY